MLQRLVIILVFLGASSSVHARPIGFSGKWIGSGQMTDPRTGRSESCDRAEIMLDLTQTYFYVSVLKIHCGLNGQWKWKPMKFDHHEGALYRNGLRVGRVSPSAAYLDLSNDEYDWRASFDLRDGQLSYSELLRSTEVSVELSAILVKNPIRRLH